MHNQGKTTKGRVDVRYNNKRGRVVEKKESLPIFDIYYISEAEDEIYLYFYEGVNHFSTYPKNDKMIFKYIIFETSSGSAEYVFEEKNLHHLDRYEYLHSITHLVDYINVYDIS